MFGYLSYVNEKKPHFNIACQNGFIQDFIKEFLALTNNKFNNFSIILAAMNAAITTILAGKRSKLNTMNPFENEYTQLTILSYEKN